MYYINIYYHIVATYDGEVLKLYVDGLLRGDVQNSDFELTEANLRIGRQVNDSSEFWYGAVANTRVYRVSLTSQEVVDKAVQQYIISQNASKTKTPLDLPCMKTP